MGDDRPCNMEDIRIGTTLIKIFDDTVRELKEVRYVHQLKKNLISVGTLKASGLEILVKIVFSRCLKARWF